GAAARRPAAGSRRPARRTAGRLLRGNGRPAGTPRPPGARRRDRAGPLRHRRLRVLAGPRPGTAAGGRRARTGGARRPAARPAGPRRLHPPARTGPVHGRDRVRPDPPGPTGAPGLSADGTTRTVRCAPVGP